MIDATQELKIRARLLQRRIQEGDPLAIARLRILPAHNRPEATTIQRKHCLHLLAKELGFRDWSHALSVFQGEANETDFGTLLSPRPCSGFLNAWFANYDQARDCLEQHKGYLLGYKRDFVVVQADYISALGLHPYDPGWESMTWDWVRPKDRRPRLRFYGELIAARPKEIA